MSVTAARANGTAEEVTGRRRFPKVAFFTGDDNVAALDFRRIGDYRIVLLR